MGSSLCTAFLLFNPEIMVIICAGVLVLFGGKKIPEFMRGLGRGVVEFKKGIEEEAEPDHKEPRTTTRLTR